MSRNMCRFRLLADSLAYVVCESSAWKLLLYKNTYAVTAEGIDFFHSRFVVLWWTINGTEFDIVGYN